MTLVLYNQDQMIRKCMLSFPLIESLIQGRKNTINLEILACHIQNNCVNQFFALKHMIIEVNEEY